MIHPEVGYFDAPDQTEPAYDPPHDGPCLICRKPLTPDDIRTLGLMYQDRNPPLSVFYRTHRTCHEGLTSQEEGMYDMSVLNMLKREGKGG